MADLTTLAGIESELAQTADYDVCYDVSKAQRRVAAIRRKLDFPMQSGRRELEQRFDIEVMERQLQQCLLWISANNEPNEQQRLLNPDVTHADFSTFRGYDDRRRP